MNRLAIRFVIDRNRVQILLDFLWRRESLQKRELHRRQCQILAPGKPA